MSDINIGAIAEALNDKSDRDLRNVDNVAGADAVIEYLAPTAQSTYTWYRKYASGWVEQGGKAYTNGGNPTPITLPIEMVNTNYISFIQGETGSDGYSGATWQVMPVNTATSPKTATGFYAQGSITGYNLGFVWRVEGMAA